MNPLISVVRAQQAINRSSWPVAETDRVATLIGVISQAAEKWARRKFAKITHDLILSYQRDPLWLPNGPIHQIVSITEGSSLRPLSFEAILPLGQVLLGAGFADWGETTPPERLVRVVYEGGFDPIPDDIQEAIALWTASSYWQTEQDPASAREGPPPAAACLLRPYRRTLFP